MDSAIVKATKPADARPLIDLPPRELPVGRGRLWLWLGGLLLMQFERATPADAARVEALLRPRGLPLDGAAEALELGVLARDDGLSWAAAVEPFEAAGLLR